MLTRLWSRAVQTGFHHLYTTLAPLYDGVAWLVSRGDWQAWGQAALPFTQPGRVLELGGGPGHLLPHLAGRAVLAVGVERSPAMLRQAARRRGAGWLVQGQAQALPFADGVFTTVVSVFPAPYIAAPATLAEISRALGATGRLVVVDDAELTGRDAYTALVNLAYALTSRPVAATPLPERLMHYHFQLTYHTVASARGRVTVMVADKILPSKGPDETR